MSNFDFLKLESKFDSFSDAALSAEVALASSPESSVLLCRRAMELAIKWMYSVDKYLEKPWDEKLITLMSTDDFREIIDPDLLTRMHFIRKIGNTIAHSDKKISRDAALICLENLFYFMDFVAYCYADKYTKPTFSRESFSEISVQPAVLDTDATAAQMEKSLEQLMKENASLREQLTVKREEQQPTYSPKPRESSEFKTRKIYIDVMLADAGWVEGKNWISEYRISGMPNKSETGFADYALCGDDGSILAVVEAKKTSVDVAQGRQQAKLYADLIEKKQGIRPVVFLSNGFDIRIIDNQYPERKIAAFYSKRDLEKLLNLQRMRKSLKNIQVDKNIAGRYYQEAAIKSVCESFDSKNRRKALLVMATGSGKTRTVIALCKALLEQGWVRNILFLADRTSLVTQAKRSFVNLLPSLSVTNLSDGKENYTAHGVFSTYQTMMNCIDEATDGAGKLFTAGHFDLVICDEAHRSIYNKYKDIFNYFDAPLVGLTATPKDEIDKNTYEIFELENGIPTYGYDLAQAVKDGYLVDFISVETSLKFMEKGIVYDELSDDDKRVYEETFEYEDGELPASIDASKLNENIFNEDTIREVLNVLMTEGLKVEYGTKIGKTIIFAKNHNHAEKILEVFNKEYPHLNNYAKVIDNHMTYAQSAIDEFSIPDKLPQIAISVDMLDTGIDVPEILNLVFFKKVMSKAKFWQMIGRGTRLCPGLLDGEDKKKFYIFDFCGNFEFFRMNKGRTTQNQLSLQGALFSLQFEMAYKLQELEYQTDELIKYRKNLVNYLAKKVSELNRENFAVRQHLRYVTQYAEVSGYQALAYEDTLIIKEELAPLIHPDDDDVTALRFDALVYGAELAHLMNGNYQRAKNDIMRRVAGVSTIAHIPQIAEQSTLINEILHTDYLENADIHDFEHIRKSLRDLMKYIPKTSFRYDTDFDDEILSVNWKESEIENDDLENYKVKAESYIRQHQDNAAVAKLKNNMPLQDEDVSELERILWQEIGTQQDYEAEYGDKPLGEFVREIVGLDMNAAKAAFAQYLDEASMDSRQIYFVNQVVEYIVRNGTLKDFRVLQEAPFTDKGSLADIFTDVQVLGIRDVIQHINANVLVA
ncbi:DEAD/DEAH box helicase family protein [Alloscardovia venturai]|uniref:DEAD/DEAH box helicase family protein n=1 Tax=Alloscardovia venturai TaxID=1769421 RepID=A0ABW2Y5A1_9BIFI